MIDNSSVVLENGIKYDVLDKIKSDNCSYIYLINPEDETDICVRKEIKEPDDNYLVGLDDEEEFKEAMILFFNNNKEKN